MNESLVQQLRRLLKESLGDVTEAPPKQQPDPPVRDHGEQYETLQSDYGRSEEVFSDYDEDVFDEYDEAEYAGEETGTRNISSRFDDVSGNDGKKMQDSLTKSLLQSSQSDESILSRVHELLHSKDGLATAIVLQEIINRPEHRWQ